MKKKLLLVLMLIAAVVVMPRVYAEETAKTITLGKVEDITNQDTLKSEEGETTKSLDDKDLSNVTITYEVAKFQLLGTGEDAGVTGRDDGYAWIGFRVTNATNATKYSVKFNGKEVDETPKTLSENSFDDYIGFNVENLKAAANAGKNLEYTYEITWEGEDGVEAVTQTIKVVVVPKGIVLLEKAPTEGEAEAKEVWNAEEYAKEVKTVKVTVKAMKDGKDAELPETAVTEYTLKEVYTLTDEQVAAIKAVLTDEDVELVGLYTDAELKTEFDATKALDADVTVYVAYKTKEKAPVEEEKAPDTVDNGVMYIALAGASLLAASGIAVYFKKANE